MSRENISFPTYYGQLGGIIDRLSKRTPDLSVRHIIIVPDRVTLTAESMLCERLGGAFDVSVMTFNRLFQRLERGEHEYLPKQGSVMVMKKLLAQHRASLECFTRSAERKGFALLLYETISMLIGCNVRPDEIGDVRGKGHDLKLMYEKYLGETEGKLVDAGGRMKLLKAALSAGDYLTDAHIYICCFDNLTPQMKDILDVFERRARSLTVCGLAPERSSIDRVELYCAPGKVLIAKAAAARMARLIKSGKASPDDFCVVTADGRADELKRILDENSIPYSAPEPKPLTRHPLGMLISSALSAISKNYRAEDVISLAKNPLSGVEKPDSDCFERYIVKYNISFVSFAKKPEDFGSDANDAEARARYDGALRAWETLKKLLYGKKAEGLHDTVEFLINYAKNHREHDPMENDDGRADPYEKARELNSLTKAVLGDSTYALAADAFICGMDAVELSQRPPYAGCVEIGDEGSFRARRYKYVFVLDFDFDNHPQVLTDSALISDDDITALRGKNVDISPTVSEVNARRAEELMQLFGGADELFLGYSQKPGNFLSTLTAEADIKCITENSYDRENAELLGAGSAEVLLYQCPTRSFLFECYRSAQGAVAAGFDAPLYLPYLKEVVGKDAERFGHTAAEGSIGILGDLAIESTTSASKIETYAACPAKHFFAHGLRARPVDTGEVMPVDVGNILHNAAEFYINDGAPEPDGVVEDIFRRCLAEYKKVKGVDCDPKYADMLLKETRLLLTEINRHISAGSYKPVAAELEFNYTGAMTANGKSVALKGKIDRVDASGRLCRIVDYKTGRAKFALGDVYAGVKLQLMLYLGYMVSEKGYEPGGAYYFPVASDWEESEITLDGLTEKSEASVLAADREAYARGGSTVINAKTSRGKFTVKNGYSAGDIGTLTTYAYKLSSQVLAEISDGFAAPSPYDVRICKYCDYLDCCGYEGEGRKLPKVKL